MQDIERLYSQRAKNFKASEIRELLKLTEKPDIISFAGGLPDPSMFPVDEIREATDHVMRHHCVSALQYGSTEGLKDLREHLAKSLMKDGVSNIGPDNVLITAGSQQGLDLIGKVFCDPGDVALVGSPTYLGGINAFRSYQAILKSVALDENGMNTDFLEERVTELKKMGITPKFIYTIPNFQNPSGVVMSESRRKKMVDIAAEHDLVVIEDDPYGKLRFDGEHVKPIKAFDDEGYVIYLGTFSKILAPGFRLAWMIGDADVIRKFAIAKQAVDLCTNMLAQTIAYECVKRGVIENHLPKIIKSYGEKRDIMLKAMDEHFPKDGCKWTRSQGGMFTWVTLPEKVDTVRMFPEAVEAKVAYVNGKAFYVDGDGANTMRLNFSYSSKEQIKEGIKRLGAVLERHI
ncbi:MAG: aminotransferase [Thermoplasmata archaeon HGW-Thermoplasmata-1]|nr:MAG: aminotransferase [Thermoplasmata archaeon HGW-Thermoplasmata-1]